MDSDDAAPTPRSGRKKKSNLLRLKGKGRSHNYSDSASESQESEPTPRYPIDADVRITPGRSNSQDDSDEGIEMGNSTFNSTYASRGRLGANNLGDSIRLGESATGSTIHRMRNLNMESGHLQSSDDDTGERMRHRSKGEKRFRDTNSSGEDLATDSGRARSKKHSASDSHMGSDMDEDRKSTGTTDSMTEFQERVKAAKSTKTFGVKSSRYGDMEDVEMEDKPISSSPPKFGSKYTSEDVNFDSPSRNLQPVEKVYSKDSYSSKMRSNSFSSKDRPKELDDSFTRSDLRKSDRTPIRSSHSMDKTFTLRELGDGKQSLADRYRDSLEERENVDEFDKSKASLGFDVNDKHEMSDNISDLQGKLRPSSSGNPPAQFSRTMPPGPLPAMSVDRPWSTMQRFPSADVMSERSYQSSSQLHPVTTKDVKER